MVEVVWLWLWCVGCDVFYRWFWLHVWFDSPVRLYTWLLSLWWMDSRRGKQLCDGMSLLQSPTLWQEHEGIKLIKIKSIRKDDLSMTLNKLRPGFYPKITANVVAVTICCLDWHIFVLSLTYIYQDFFFFMFFRLLTDSNSISHTIRKWKCRYQVRPFSSAHNEFSWIKVNRLAKAVNYVSCWQSSLSLVFGLLAARVMLVTDSQPNLARQQRAYLLSLHTWYYRLRYIRICLGVQNYSIIFPYRARRYCRSKYDLKEPVNCLGIETSS
jgi:hypothetical protein